MIQGTTSFWRRPLPLFIRVVGWLLMLYAVFMVVGSIMAAWVTRHMEFQGITTWPWRISETMVLVVSVLIVFSGLRMSRPTDRKALAEFSAVVALLVARLVNIGITLKFQPGIGSLVALAAAILVYVVVRYRLYAWLKRLLLDEALPEAIPA